MLEDHQLEKTESSGGRRLLSAAAAVAVDATINLPDAASATRVKAALTADAINIAVKAAGLLPASGPPPSRPSRPRASPPPPNFDAAGPVPWPPLSQQPFPPPQSKGSSRCHRAEGKRRDDSDGLVFEGQIHPCPGAVAQARPAPWPDPRARQWQLADTDRYGSTNISSYDTYIITGVIFHSCEGGPPPSRRSHCRVASRM
jgi:hypothetical protein